MLTSNLILDKSLTLTGPGVTSPDVTISSGKHDYEILVDSRISVSIKDLAFKEGALKGNHFIHNYGTLVLDNTTISENSIKGLNTALIYNDRGQLTISNSTISDNIGEIYNRGGPLTITNSIISNMNRNNPDKTIDGSPSAIYNDADGSLTIWDSTIADNIAYYNGGGIYNGGVLTIGGSTISGNSFLSIPGPDGTKNGGGIANDVGATPTISSSTIAGNIAGYSGGGIANWGTVHISFCTIYDNHAKAGGGIAVLAGSGTLSNSILAGNTLVSGGQLFHPHMQGMLLSQGYNLLQNMTHLASVHLSAPDTANIDASHFTSVHDKNVSFGTLSTIFDPERLQSNGVRNKTYKLSHSLANPTIDAVPLAFLQHPSHLCQYYSQIHRPTGHATA